MEKAASVPFIKRQFAGQCGLPQQPRPFLKQGLVKSTMQIIVTMGHTQARRGPGCYRPFAVRAYLRFT